MSHNLTEREKEYLFEAVYGYLNGFNDIGWFPDNPDDPGYPPLTCEELVQYGYKTIAFERDTDPTYQSIYFAGRDAIEAELERIIRAEPDFQAVVTDWA